MRNPIYEETEEYRIYFDDEQKDFFIEFKQDDWIKGPYRTIEELKRLNKKEVNFKEV